MNEEKQHLIERKNNIHAANRTEKQHKSGKLTAWERISYLVDENSFIETNMFVEHRCSYFGMDSKRFEGDGVITGYGKINGRTVCVYAQDFTIMGGSISEMNAKKISDIQNKALKMGVPIIGLIDSSGARIQEGIQSLSGHGFIFYNNVQSSGKIPQISAIMGSCAGGASYSPALTDFILMVRGTGTMFITGPKVVKAAIGEDVTMEELGGSKIHSSVSGMTDLIAENDTECLDQIKKLLEFLPDNHLKLPNREFDFKYTDKKMSEISRVLPESNRVSFDVMQFLDLIIDDDSMLEIKPDFATNIVTCFAKIGGQPVGIVANQSQMIAGCLDIDAADKAARFIRLCDSFNIPLLTFVDVPGFLPGSSQEHKGIIRHGAKMLYAYGESSVLKITIILRKAYGGAYLAMCSKELGADFVYIWPKGEVAVMGAESAINVIYSKESEDVKAERLEEYNERFLTPNEAVHMGYVDEIIEPETTREKIMRIVNMYADDGLSQSKKFHGNIPL